MNLSVLQIILITINLNFLIFSIFLFKNRNGNTNSNRILAVAMIIMAYINTHFVLLYDKQVYLFFPHFVGGHMPFLYLIPPFIFFFYKSVFDNSFNLRKINTLHFIPAVIVLLIYFPLYISPVEYKINFIKTGVCYIPFLLLAGLFFLQFVTYLVIILWDIQKIINKSKSQMTADILRYFGVAKILTFALLIILVITVAMKLNIIYIPVFSSVVYYFIIYHILVHPEIFFTCKFASEEMASNKYKNSNLTSALVQNIYSEVITHIKRKQVYLDYKISLPKLSYQLDIPIHHISQAINQQSNLNFNDFINQFRSEHCKEILLDEKYSHYTMEAIGELSGFKSRQTLIKSFKKFYNQTPSEFIKMNK